MGNTYTDYDVHWYAVWSLKVRKSMYGDMERCLDLQMKGGSTV